MAGPGNSLGSQAGVPMSGLLQRQRRFRTKVRGSIVEVLLYSLQSERMGAYPGRSHTR